MKQWYCPLPFKHVYVDTTGVAPCCQITRQPVALDQWHNNHQLIELQQNFLQGRPSPQCEGCAKSESVHGRSLRTDAWADYQHHKFFTLDIDFVDYRSSNICNFKCRSCEPAFSHGIANEVKSSDVLSKFYSVIPSKTAQVDQDNTNWIMNNLGRIKRLMFTGGEPTVIPAIRNIIKEIQNNHRDSIQVIITSNGSFTDDFWRQITLDLPNLHWTVSLDATGPAAEVIRHGTVWSQVSDNARWLALNSPSLDINTVVSNLNVFHLGPLLDFAQELNSVSKFPQGRHGDQGSRHQFHVLQRPNTMSVDNLPADLKQPALNYLEQCLTQNLLPEQQRMIQGVSSLIQRSVFDPELWQRFCTINQEFDRVRGENHASLLYK